jgi:dimethylhistidine N-methyltransferase
MDVQPSQAGPSPRDFWEEVFEGLSRTPAQIPSKYLYDATGSELFEAICRLPEYYPYRIERELMTRYARQMAWLIGPEARVVELGCGSGEKTRLLLEALADPMEYVPVDICAEALTQCTRAMVRAFPGLDVKPVCADYSISLPLPTATRRDVRTLIYYPGSTIGNLRPDYARAFLARMAQAAGSRSNLLVGVDLKKDPALIERAYNDRRGVTAQFNRNVLVRLNEELGADFNPKAFVHDAPYLEDEGCVEMRLISARPQQVRIRGHRFDFDDGDVIVTERSYKYSIFEFTALAKAAGWRCRQFWTDEENAFGIWLFRAG